MPKPPLTAQGISNTGTGRFLKYSGGGGVDTSPRPHQERVLVCVQLEKKKKNLARKGLMPFQGCDLINGCAESRFPHFEI